MSTSIQQRRAAAALTPIWTCNFPNNVCLYYSPIIAAPEKYHAPLSIATQKLVHFLTLRAAKDFGQIHADELKDFFTPVTGYRPSILNFNIALEKEMDSSMTSLTPLDHIFYWICGWVELKDSGTCYHFTLLYYSAPPVEHH